MSRARPVYAWLAAVTAASCLASEAAQLGDGAVTAISAGSTSSCAIAGGRVTCWGHPQNLQLGMDTSDSVGDNELPYQFSPGPGKDNFVDFSALPSDIAIAIKVSPDHACAQLDTDDLVCWNKNDFGQMGRGSKNPLQLSAVLGSVVPLPTPPGASNNKVKDFAVGPDHTCALMTSGDVICWGGASQGQLGYGNGNDVSTPQNIVQLPTPPGASNNKVQAIDAGKSFTCALMESGHVICWGRAQWGRLGTGSANGNVGLSNTPTTFVQMPTPASGMSSTVSAISCGTEHACALTTSGQVACWGRNGALHLGVTTSSSFATAPPAYVSMPAGTPPFVSVSAGGSHSCAVLQDNRAICWGSGHFGEHGSGVSTPSTGALADEFVQVSAMLGYSAHVASISAGSSHTCLTTTDGEGLCFGRGDHGRLGQGSTSSFGSRSPIVPVGPLQLLPPPPSSTPSPTPSPSGTASGTPSNSPSSSTTASPTTSSSQSASTTATVTVTPSNSATETPTQSVSATATVSGTPSPSSTGTPSFSSTGTPSWSPTGTPSWSPTSTPSSSSTGTPSPSSSSTPSSSVSAPPSPSATGSVSLSASQAAAVGQGTLAGANDASSDSLGAGSIAAIVLVGGVAVAGVATVVHSRARVSRRRTPARAVRGAGQV